MEKLGIQVRVILLSGGKLQIFVDNGTQEQATDATKRVLAQLQASGIPLSTIGEIELHRSGADHVHVTSEVHLDH